MSITTKSFLSLFFLMCSLILAETTVHAQASHSINFNGASSGSAGTPSPAGLNITGKALTVEAWIYPTSFGSNYWDGSVIGKDGGANTGFVLRCGATGMLSFVIGVTGGAWVEVVSGNNALSLNKWQHIAGIYDGAQIKILVNGIQVGAVAETRDITASASMPLLIGASPIGFPAIGRNFTGRIDASRVWNVVRTESQIRQYLFRPLPVTPGLVASYAMNEGTGTTLGDNSGNGHTVTLAAGTSWVASPVQFAGNALNFDGGSDVVNIPHNANLNIATAITLEAWVYPTSTNTVQNVVAKSSMADNRGFIFPRTDNGWNSTTMYLFIGGGWRTVSATVPLLNAWHHLAATYDGANMRIYVDGVLANTVAQTGAITSTANPLAFGNQPGYSEYYGGSVDEVRIWNVARTQAQIQADMTREIDPAAQTGLVSYYTANQGTASNDNTGLTLLPDLKGTNDGTLSSFTLNSPASNFIVQSTMLVLPVRWNSFTVQSTGDNKALLRWSTASEQNTRDFQVQRSLNGSAWETIGVVQAAGNSNQLLNYDFTDHTILPGRNFYRIQQRDLDGRATFSAVRSLQVSATPAAFTLLENPVKSAQLNIQVNKDLTVLSLVNANGVPVWTKQYNAGTRLISLAHLAKGVYILKSGSQTERIVIQ